MNIDNVKKAAELMTQAQDLLSRGPFSYYLTELVGSHQYLMDRFCPYKIGDKVLLVKTPDTNNGWRGYKDILVRGALGTVMSVECGPKGFTFGIAFDDERQEYESDKHQFNFGENYLVKARNESI